MKTEEAGNLWPGLSTETQSALQRAALLASAPLPFWLVTKAEEEILPAFQGLLTSAEDHDLWGTALVLDPGFLGFLQSNGAPRLSESDTQTFVNFAVTAFCSYFVWPPTEMLWNAGQLEPHLAKVADLARRQGLYGDLARLQHQRALLLAWKTQKYELPLTLAQEAADAFRKTDGGKPHPGTLALILTGLAAWQHSLRQDDAARSTLLEAEQRLIPLVGKSSIEPFLLYCQQASVCEALKDTAGADRARDEARAILKVLADPRLEKHLAQTLSWAQWHLQRYIGF